MYRSIGRSATELQAELVLAIGTQPGGSVSTVPTCCRRRYYVGSASTDVGADRCRPATHGVDMCRPGPSGPEVARRGSPPCRAALSVPNLQFRDIPKGTFNRLGVTRFGTRLEGTFWLQNLLTGVWTWTLTFVTGHVWFLFQSFQRKT
jgi:hypothetical protein